MKPYTDFLLVGMFKKPILSEGSVQSVPSGVEGKAAALVPRGAHAWYVSANAAKSGIVCELEGDKMATMSGRSQGTPLAALRPGTGFFQNSLLKTWIFRQNFNGCDGVKI